MLTVVQDVKNNGPVSKIDLWDEAHKKKNGKYTNENVQQLMVLFFSLIVYLISQICLTSDPAVYS